MSPIRNVLWNQNLTATLPPMTPAHKALLRIREEMTERKISQRDLAEALNCSQGRVAKIMGGGVNLRFNDLAILADAVKISLVETVRDRGLEFFAELSPSEVRLLEKIRQRPEVLDALMDLLELKRPNVPKSRTLGPKRNKVGRPLSSQKRVNGP